MSRLLDIRQTTQEVAEAITAALGIDVEIIDDRLTIIAGTGRYKEKIGQKEEEGNVQSGLTYSQVLQTGEPYVIEDAQNNADYAALEAELAEVCCPIKLSGRVIGLMGLVAFTEQQRHTLLCNRGPLLTFLERMAYLLASKVSETKIATELTSIVETIRDGILAVDKDGIITSCNMMAERLIGQTREQLIGIALSKIWPDSSFHEVLQSGVGYRDREEIHTRSPLRRGGMPLHFFTTVMPINASGHGASSADHAPIGTVLSFRDSADVRRMVYDLTEKEESSSFQEIIGTSETILRVKEQGQKIALSNSTVLITGESGTGKSLFARAIHHSGSRKKRPFITVNCGAIPDALLESELFGYEPGAFTGASKNGKVGKFELANGGTIFLDEIGDLSLHLQVKLLHVLQYREIERVGSTRSLSIDVRVIAATNRDLEQMITDGEFREDLFFRLNVIPLHLPSLKERQEDIPLLLTQALARHARLIGKEISGFDQETMELLVSYQWPGNIRELENVVEYAVNLATERLITVDSIPARLRRTHSGEKETRKLKAQLDVFEKQIIERVLRETGYSVEDKVKAAKLLGISESTLYRRIRELGIRARP
ncbi:PAS domain-containing protein [Brevibacillus fluminis]|uniref:PAS domain-containing protein n=1 Tax=Brevibacillus fluminis TaxID=511487 RepID=A0A3M8DFJ5_9BACL|nr:sigma 54-interacting transcriptional regulator [Brevibacillus fluminis]RNB85967.1 PAS domain-containing protein [Brevibacillus fluminis]